MKITVLFGRNNVNGTIMARNGKVGRLHAPGGNSAENRFQLPQGGRLEISFSEFTLKCGAFPTICNVVTDENPFAFNLRDVNSATPVFIPEFQAAVVPGGDARDYAQVAGDVAARGLISDFTRFDNAPEESYAHAARLNRRQYCSTWLGLGRDMRMFRVGYQERYEYWGQIQPCYHSIPQYIPVSRTPIMERTPPTAYQVNFEIGQGTSCRPQITRRQEDGVLPILRSTQVEQDVHYNLVLFASLEKAPLSADAVRGSEWDACYANAGGNMLTAEQKTAMYDRLQAEMRQREQEVVCCLRVEAVNTGKTPRYAWFKAGHICGFPGRATPDKHQFKNGFSVLESAGTVYAVNRLDDQALPEEEMAVLLQPGQTVKFDILIPHSPLDAARAQALLKLDFNAHLDACREYWRARLASAAKITVPEKPIQENIQAGLLHCDLVALGREPDGPVLATIGWYAPIGTESAPIIQFFDSMGWHKLAERCLDFFFVRQRPDGFIQNFGKYESETGPLLWTAGEHFRYTRDAAWLKRVLPNIRKAADYLLQWRERNKLEEYRAKGFYGMVNGKVADCNDFYHSFFLNAGTYVGLKRVAEILRDVDPEYARMLAGELPEYLKDIRAGFYHAQARAPLIPLADGSWAPLMPPWVEYTGGISFYADGGNWFTHGAFAARSCLTGPLWLVISEALDPAEIGAKFMLKTNQYPVTLENAALSQPYYCRHDYAHIRRGEVAAFLKTYYNQITALQDRETYTFWEHYHHASEHKTHEQAWFLMQTRWMLWLEDGNDLRLLSAIPRAWLADGQTVRLDQVATYFGPLTLAVESQLGRNRISAQVKCDGGRKPKTVLLRLPHPEGRRAVRAQGGVYDAASETVRIAPFAGKAEITLYF
ncbi:MAG: hypothetical protein PHW60_08555 [Kiritimatiellae bacterium]|nr:hypothetical protein [Kiritimatiellia bacterium]